MSDLLEAGLSAISANRLSEARKLLEPLASNADSLQSTDVILKAKCALSLIAKSIDDFSAAESLALDVLAIDADNLSAKCLLLSTYSNWGKPDKAYEMACVIPASELPSTSLHAYCQALVNRGDYRKFEELGDFLAIIESLDEESLPNYLGIHGLRNRVFDKDSVNRYLALQCKWGDYMMSLADKDPISPLTSKTQTGAVDDGRLCLGFYGLSSIPATQKVLKPVMEAMDRSFFKLKFAFIEQGAGVRTDEGFTELFDEIVVVPRGSNREVAEKLQAMGCDVLIDLNGLQQPATRLGAMAWRIAPLQLSWTGRPISAGLPALDYNIVDEVLAGDGSGCLNETIRLPEAFACFGRMPAFDIPEGLPSEAKGQITFGINAEPAKYNLTTIELWAAVLRELKDSRLAFIRPEYESAFLQKNILREFKTLGIAKKRIEFWYENHSNREHMKAYNDVDVLLDCYPMTGGIGMLEAMHMGVPAVSLEGAAIQLRVGASHLHAVGLDGLRAKTGQEYVQKALALAKHTELRRAIRAQLRSKLAQSAFADTKKFASDFNMAMKALSKHKNLNGKFEAN